MPSAASSARPAWLYHPVARFFASLKLAVVLLAVLIIAAISGTIYESTFDAKVARAYVYGAPWFNIWLTLLAANLAVSALSRWPWRKHHTAFLVTHLGIITLLTGSLIGRIWGIEGTITLFKGDPPNNRLLVDQHQLRVGDIDGVVKGYPAEFLHHPPTPTRPRDLGVLASGAHLSIIEYAPGIAGRLNPKPLADGGVPALHFTVTTAMMNQHLESWLLADDPQHAAFSMGLANIELKRGAATAATKTADESGSSPVDIEESIFAFSKAPDEQIGRVNKGGSTGAKVRLEAPTTTSNGRVVISVSGKEAAFPLRENVGRVLNIEGTPFHLKIENYWPDFRIQDGKPASLSDQPNNPAVLVTLEGKGPGAAARPAPSHNFGGQFGTNGGPPAMPPLGEETANHLTLFVDSNGNITYDLASRKNGNSSGKIELNNPVATGWADWQVVVDKVMLHATPWVDFNPTTPDAQSGSAGADLPDGVRLRIQQNGGTFEQWVPAGWQIAVPTTPRETLIAYGFRQIPLPIGLELLNFEVKRNEGNDSPAGFKSTLRVSIPEGESAVGSCWMNHPYSFPQAWWRPWTGLTYKISQASWNPDNLNQSTVQILRDPGWLFKWIGSLLVVAGVFMMFYLRPYRKQTVGEPILPTARPKAKTAKAQALARKELIPH